ncbi:ferric reductase-like transmembrane domain-containing protein [Seohaeicola saemankumensis]|uniref:Ferric reductase-like transmembrane domain-containing protein n=1 Tax=Seohaeicola saemankumensis TaxID=481181 RepID=A0ABW3T9E6_9RHOB
MSGTPDRKGRHVSLRLPGRGLAVIYLGLCLFPIVLAGFSQAAPLDGWEAFGAGLGLSGLASLVLQLLTSGRFRLVSGRMGIDRIMAFHKIAAMAVLLALLVHPLAYVLPTFLDDPARGAERLIAYGLLPAYRSGVVALVALLLLVVTGVLRDWMHYETWRAMHLILSLVALGGGLHHALTAGRLSAMGPLRAMWLVDAVLVVVVIGVLYGWRWWRLHRRPFVLRHVQRMADRIWEMDIAPGPVAPATDTPAADIPALNYRAGQFVWMTAGARRFPLFDHPFSIADSPTRPTLRLIIKEAGDFTRTVGALAPGTPVGIDGPFGTFTLSDHPGDSVVLIAGGVGIAPIMGLLRDLVARRDPRPVRLAYAVGRPENFACLDEIAQAATVLDLQVMLISETASPDWQQDIGLLDRPRLARLIKGLAPRTCVAMICGPGPMISAVSDQLLSLGLPMANVVYERFDYAGALGGRKDRYRAAQYLALLLGQGALVWVLSRLLV